MANKTAIQTILDGDRNVTVLATGVLDTSNLASTALIDVSALAPAATDLILDEVAFSVTSPLQVILSWDATTDDEALCLVDSGQICLCEFGGLPNPRSSGWNGDLLIKTLGYASGTVSYSVLVKAKKI